MKLWLEVCLPAFFLPTKKELELVLVQIEFYLFVK